MRIRKLYFYSNVYLAGLSLTGSTALCHLARQFIFCLVPVQQKTNRNDSFKFSLLLGFEDKKCRKIRKQRNVFYNSLKMLKNDVILFCFTGYQLLRK